MGDRAYVSLSVRMIKFISVALCKDDLAAQLKIFDVVSRFF